MLGRASRGTCHRNKLTNSPKDRQIKTLENNSIIKGKALALGRADQSLKDEAKKATLPSPMDQPQCNRSGGTQYTRGGIPRRCGSKYL